MATKPTVHGIRDVDSDATYAAARAKTIELQQRRNELDRKIMANVSLRNQNRERLDAAAQAMIDGGDVTALDENALETKRTALYRERSIVHRALELHKPGVDAAREKAALAIRLSVIDRHKTIGRRIASAMTELRAAMLAENDFRTELNVAGVGGGEPLLTLGVPLLGQADNVEGPYWMLSRWLKQTHEYLGE